MGSALALGIVSTLGANAISAPQVNTGAAAAFSISEMPSTTLLISNDADHKCGEGKCGGDKKKDGDHKCGGDKKKDGDHKCGGEHKCGAKK